MRAKARLAMADAGAQKEGGGPLVLARAFSVIKVGGVP